MDLGNGLRLDLGGRASFAYHSRSQTIALTNVGGHIWSLDFVPDGKILYGINDKFAVYGDFGLGLAYLDQTAEATGVPTASSSSVQLTIQFGGGVSYAISPTMNLLGEIRINVYTGSGTGTFFALPTVGVQWH
jgi:opacity protein-like surface antigen